MTPGMPASAQNSTTPRNVARCCRGRAAAGAFTVVERRRAAEGDEQIREHYVMAPADVRQLRAAARLGSRARSAGSKWTKPANAPTSIAENPSTRMTRITSSNDRSGHDQDVQVKRTVSLYRAPDAPSSGAR